MPEEIVTPEVTENDTQENEVELSEDEKNQIGEEASNKFNSVFEQKKHWREKAKKAEEEKVALEAKIAELSKEKGTEKSETSKEVLSTLASLERDKFLKGVSEDNRAKVQEVYSALTAGKEISPTEVEDYMSLALKANDIKPATSSYGRIASSATGSIPRETKKVLSQEDIAFAQKSGTDPKALENIDFSNMANAEQLLQAEQDNDIRSKSII